MKKESHAQAFLVLPRIVVAKYLKIEFFGKPTNQSLNQYYHVINYVSLRGSFINKLDGYLQEYLQQVITHYNSFKDLKDHSSIQLSSVSESLSKNIDSFEENQYYIQKCSIEKIVNKLKKCDEGQLSKNYQQIKQLYKLIKKSNICTNDDFVVSKIKPLCESSEDLENETYFY